MEEQKVKTVEVESTTNSELGSYHWFATLIGRNLRMGEFLKDKTPDEETIRIWGKNLYDNCKELIAGHDKINSDQSHITKLEQQVSDLETALIITKNSRKSHIEKNKVLELRVKELEEALKQITETNWQSNNGQYFGKGTVYLHSICKKIAEQALNKN